MGFQIGIFRRKNKHFDSRGLEEIDKDNTVLIEPTTEAQGELSISKPETAKSAQTNIGSTFKEAAKFAYQAGQAVRRLILASSSQTNSLTVNSLYLFSRKNKFRLLMIGLSGSKVYSGLVDLLVLSMNFRLLYWNFREEKWVRYDAFGIICGFGLLVETLVFSIAYGFIGHPRSYLMRNPFNIFKAILMVVYFWPRVFFFQVVQVFRIVSVLGKIKDFKPVRDKTMIIRKSMVSLALFVLLYLALLFLFSVFSWAMFYKSMGKYCLQSGSTKIEGSLDSLPELRAVSFWNDLYRLQSSPEMTQAQTNDDSYKKTGFSIQNFKDLKNSFYINFLISSMINLTSISTELSMTGGYIYSSFYVLLQAILFGFTVKSFFVSILYDIIVNRDSDNTTQNESILETSKTKKQTDKQKKKDSFKRGPSTLLDSEFSAMNSMISNNLSYESPDGSNHSKSPKKQAIKLTNFVNKIVYIAKTSRSCLKKISICLMRRSAVQPPAYYTQNSLMRGLNRFIFTYLFSVLHTCLILLNVVLLSSSRSPGGPVLAICTSIQALLLAILLLMCTSLGFDTCTSDASLMFDVCICAVSVLDCLQSHKYYSRYSTMTIFRLLVSLREIIRSTTFSTALEFVRIFFPTLSYFFMMMILVVVCFAQIGSQVFASLDLEYLPQNNFIVRPFSTFKESIITSIELIFGNNWSLVFYSCIVKHGGLAFTYYFAVVIIGKQILMNIILAFLLENMKQIFEKLHLKSKMKYAEIVNRLKYGLSQYMAQNKPSKKIPVLEKPEKNFEVIIEENDSGTGNLSPANESQGIQRNHSSVEINSVLLREMQRENHRSSHETPRFLFNQESFKEIAWKAEMDVRRESGRQIEIEKRPSGRKLSLENNENFSNEQISKDELRGENDDITFQQVPSGDKKKQPKESRNEDFLPPILKALTKLQKPSNLKQKIRFEQEEVNISERPLIQKPPPTECFTKNNTTNLDVPRKSTINSTPATRISKARTSLTAPSRVLLPRMTLGNRSNSTLSVVKSNSRFSHFRQSSLFILHRDLKLRKMIIKTLEHRYFEYSIAGLILISSVLLAINSPLLDPASSVSRIMRITDICITTLFSAEFLLKVLGYGAFSTSLSGKKPYFRVNWNILDFAILSISVWNYIYERDMAYLKSFKVLRLLKLLGPLSKIGRSMTLKIVVDSIFTTSFKLMVLAVFCLMCITPFAVIGLYSYKDNFEICISESMKTWSNGHCSQENDTGSFSANSPNSFANFFEGILTSVVILTGEGFFFMYRFLMQYKTENEASYLMILQTFVAYYFMSLFLQNSFACFTITSFLELKQTKEGTANLNDRERRIFEMQKQFIRKSLKVRKTEEASSKIEGFLTKAFSSLWFEVALLVKLVLNFMLIVLVASREQTQDLTPIKIVHICLLASYNLEVLAKLYGFGFSKYWSNKLNRLDLVSSAFADLLLILYLSKSTSIYFMAPVLLRIFTLGRLISKLMSYESTYTKNLKAIMEGLRFSFANLLPIFTIIFIFISAFAIIGMFFFHGIKLDKELNETFNFNYFPNSYLTLLKLITGFNWNELLSNLTESKEGCDSHQKGNSIQKQGNNRCGEAFAFPFMLFYLIIGKFLLLNLITVLVLDGYFESKKMHNLKLNEEEVEAMYKAWAEYDPTKSGMMTCDNFVLFLHEIEAPFGVREGQRIIDTAQILNKMIFLDDFRIVVTGKEVLEASRNFPLNIYTVGSQNMVHFIDYISFLTNKLNVPSGVDR